jgi:two-component system, OmpR family, sensor kinase
VHRLLGRGLRFPLRLKVMAGVAAVTLLALAALDIGVVIVTRHYVLTQTDDNLHQALTVTEPRLYSLLADALPDPVRPQKPRVPGRQLAPRPTSRRLPGLLGDYEIAFVPSRGTVVILEMGAVTGFGQQFVFLPPRTARLLATSGLRTTSLGGAPFRIQSAPVRGGSLLVGTSLGPVTATTRRFEAIVVIGSLAVVLLIGLGVFFVMRRGLRPIEAMARQADRITGGDLSERVATHDPRSEVGRLGGALNGMLARLETSQEQMRRFFADASHELRTPLASLRANAQLYQQGALQDPAEVDEVMDRVVAETRRMGQLIDDMLRLARLGQQPCRSREPVDLTAVVSDCADRAQAADPGRTWRVQVADGLTVTGDQELLRRAINNLLMNVLVHTPADATVAISTSASSGHVTIEVSDDGPGVPADDLPHILERFYRARPRSDCPGSGLGLAITAEIAAAHGGTMQAAPVSPHGLRVTLTLPTQLEGQARVPMVPEPQGALSADPHLPLAPGPALAATAGAGTLRRAGGCLVSRLT